MIKKARKSVLHVFTNEYVTNDNHGCTANMKKQIQRRIRSGPVAELFKKRNRTDNVEMLSKLLGREIQNLIKLGRREIIEGAQNLIIIIIRQAKLRLQIEAKKARKER